MIPGDIVTLARMGMRLFPLKARDKQPAIADWPNLASDREAQLEAWDKLFPACNWGVATGAGSGVWVLDFDGAEGMATFQQLARECEEFTETRAVRTGRGLHLWFQYPDDVEIRNGAKVAPGVDVRGEGGFVVIPPSIHPSGKRYEWRDSKAPIAEAPRVAQDLATKGRRKTEPKDAATNGDHHGDIPEGQRNAVLASLAGSMRRRGMDAAAMLAALRVHNADHCSPPLLDAEVSEIAASVARYRPEEPIGPVLEATEEIIRPDMPETVLDGRLGEIYQRRMKGCCLAYAWGPMVAIAGVSDFLKYGQAVRANLFWCSVGGVGTGKSAIEQRALHVLGVDPLAPFLLKAKYGSAEGLVNDVKGAGPCVRLLAPDELGNLLAKCRIENSSFPTFLTTAFYQDQQRGGTKKEQWEIDVRLSVAGGIVEDFFGDAFGSASVSGLYDRFLFGLSPLPCEYDYYPLEGTPETVSPIQPRVAGDVWEVRNEWRKSGIAGRVAENCLRVAYICAAIDGRKVLRGCELGPARALAEYQMRVRAVLQPNPGENHDAQCAISVKNWLRQHAPKGDWVRHRLLSRGINSSRLGPGVFHRCLQNLQMCDDVELDLKRKLVRLLDDDVMTGDDTCQ